ncbi:MAG: hypothetical protein RL376_129, partial [Verrucomicrobiota bacterium]
MNFIHKFLAVTALSLGSTLSANDALNTTWDDGVGGSKRAITPRIDQDGQIIFTIPGAAPGTNTQVVKPVHQELYSFALYCKNMPSSKLFCSKCVNDSWVMVESEGTVCPVNTSSVGGSQIDNVTHNFIHTVPDIKLESSAGCAPCGSSSPLSTLKNISLSQIYHSRLPGGSFCDRQSNFDVRLTCLTKADGTKVIVSANPELFGNRSHSLSGSTFIDASYEASKGITLYTAANAPTTDFAAASTAVMTLKDFSKVTFEIFLDQDNADPALRTYTGRLLSVLDKASHGFTLSYLDAASSSATPLEKARFSSASDTKGQQINFTWSSTLIGGRFAIASATGLGQSVSYQYVDNKFAGATYGDGSQSSITWSVTPSGLTKAVIFEPRLPAMDRSKEILFTSASQSFIDTEFVDGLNHFNTASMLCFLASKNGEITYMSIADSRPSWFKTLEGGILKEGRNSSHVTQYKDWTYNPDSTSSNPADAFTGTQDTYSNSNPWAASNNAKGRPSQHQNSDGSVAKYFYSADGTLRATLHSDGTVERFVYDANKNLTLKQDRTGRISKFTYDAQNNKTSHTTGWAQKRAFEVNATAPGLKVSSYVSSGSTLPDFSTLAPYAVERSLDFSLPNVMALDGFACLYEGDIEVSSPGNYSFFVKADDGAKLFIDGQEVVATPNWSTEGASVPLNLSAGKHSIKLSFFEIGGAENLSVKWQGPGISKQTIPANVLSHSVSQQELEVVATADAATESWEYYPAGHANQFLLKSHTDFKGVKDQILTYDAHNRVIKVEEINDAGNGYIAKQVLTYDSAGRIATITDANARTTAFAYDAMGRKIRSTYYDGSTEESFYATSGKSAGLVVKTKDRSGATTTYAHDANGRVVQTIRGYSIIDAKGSEVIQSASAQSVEICSYWEGSSQKEVCIRDGEKTEYAYDAQGRMIGSKTWVSATKALVSTTQYRDGKVFSTTDA